MKLGIHEERTRVVLYLPYNIPAEADAVSDTIDYLKQPSGASGHGQIKGFTHTRAIPASFEGWWWSDTRGAWVHDRLVLTVIDHEFPISDHRLHTEIDNLKRAVGQFYDQRGSAQEEIWVVTHPVWRYD